jgi:glycine cleavage system H protein
MQRMPGPLHPTQPQEFSNKQVKEKHMAKVAADLQYSDEHEWVAREGGNLVSIGISAVATEALGDIVYVDLPEAGAAVTAGETCGEVESTKSVSDLYSPVTGEVVEINTGVVDDPALINNDPYGAGWLFKVAAESEGPLLSAQEYASKNGGDL